MPYMACTSAMATKPTTTPMKTITAGLEERRQPLELVVELAGVVLGRVLELLVERSRRLADAHHLHGGAGEQLGRRDRLGETFALEDALLRGLELRFEHRVLRAPRLPPASPSGIGTPACDIAPRTRQMRSIDGVAHDVADERHPEQHAVARPVAGCASSGARGTARRAPIADEREDEPVVPENSPTRHQHARRQRQLRAEIRRRSRRTSAARRS